MKKFFKWTSIVIGILIICIVLVIAGIFISHDRYWYYPTGGEISELQAGYDVTYYDISLEINSSEQSVSGSTNIKIQCMTENLKRIELDLIDNFNVIEVLVSDKKTNFEHNDDKLVVNLEKALNQNENLNLKVYYNGQPIEALRPPWIGGFNWSKDKNENDWIGVSSQGEGGKIWFPCKAHPSDEPDSVSLNITIPDEYYCASNGILKNISIPKKNFKTYHWFTEYPTNNYNITLNIAKYKIVEKPYVTINGKSVPVVYYYLNGTEHMADSLVNMAIDMLKSLEKYFGEYPFANEKFGIAETSYLGMEHQTINSYGNKYRFRERKNFKFDQLMLHEMAHEWWGNKVTVQDWADFWIHEGIGTYTEALYLLDKLGESGYHDHMARIRWYIQNRSPIQSPKFSNSHESYSGDIYNKGAYFMHSLRYNLGDSIFFNTLYQFSNDSNYIYKNLVDTEDFLSLVNVNSGKDFTKFFNLFLKTTKLPDVKVDSLGNSKWNVSLSNIDFNLPMDIDIDGSMERKILGQKPILVESTERVIIDPQNWYLHQKDFMED